MDGFFLLSGFLIVQSWENDPELLNYLRKRLLRIVPGYVVAAILATLVIGLLAPGVSHFFSHFTYHFPESMLLLGGLTTPPVFPGMPFHSVNTSLWTIPYEFRCYLLVPLLAFLGFVRRPWLWLGTTALVFVPFSFREMADPEPWRKLYFLTGEPWPAARLCSAFLVGGCFYLFRRYVVYRLGLALLSCVLILVFLLTMPRLLEPVVVVSGGYYCSSWDRRDGQPGQVIFRIFPTGYTCMARQCCLSGYGIGAGHRGSRPPPRS